MMKPWSKGTKGMVVAIYGMVVGSGMLWAAFTQVLPHLLESGFNRDEGVLFGGIVLAGLGVSLPTVVMQALGKVVETYRAFRGRGPAG